MPSWHIPLLNSNQVLQKLCHQKCRSSYASLTTGNVMLICWEIFRICFLFLFFFCFYKLFLNDNRDTNSNPTFDYQLMWHVSCHTLIDRRTGTTRSQQTQKMTSNYSRKRWRTKSLFLYMLLLFCSILYWGIFFC